MLKLIPISLLSLLAGALISISTLKILSKNQIPQTLGDSDNLTPLTPTSTETPIPTMTPTSTPIPTKTPIPTPSSTPTPTPTETPLVAPGILENWFNQYANQYNVDPQLLKRIAYCESEFNQEAVNGIYVGIFQFNEDIWVRYREEMGHDPNPDLRSDANEAIKTAAYLISKGKLFFWPNCH